MEPDAAGAAGGMAHTNEEARQARIDEAFERAKLGLPLTDHQRLIVQFLGHGFGCQACG